MQLGWSGVSWSAFRGVVALGIVLLPGGLVLLGLLAVVLRRLRSESATSYLSTTSDEEWRAMRPVVVARDARRHPSRAA